MAFVPRTTKPDPNNKWWIQQSYGGYSPCIEGYFSQTRTSLFPGSTLPNCFSSDTEIITAEGIKLIKDCIDKSYLVPTLEGWHKATFKSFGEQKLWEVQVGRNLYYATANHRWAIFGADGSFHGFLTTDHIRPGMCIGYAFHEKVEYEPDMLAQYDGCYWSSASLEAVPKDNKQYIYNFLQGYFMSEGKIESNRRISITSGNLQTLKYLRDLFTILGIRTCISGSSSIYGFTEYSPNRQLIIYTDCLTQKFFLKGEHYKSIKIPQNPSSITRIISVSETDRVEEVYCAEEPVTHTFTLGGGELTGNCVGWAWGRFGEILGDIPSGLGRGNAGTIYGSTTGYDKSPDPNKPQVGAAIVWSVPGDAGHIAIVEEIIDSNTIGTSHSGWGSINKDWWAYITLTTGNGWHSINHIWSGYNFVGYIYNPGYNGPIGTLEGGGSDYSPSTGHSQFADKLSAFMSSVTGHVGEDNKWVNEMTGITLNSAWSAAFIVACAKSVNGLINVVIPNTFSASAIGRIGLMRGMGTWNLGPRQDPNTTFEPQPGDIMLLRTTNSNIIVNTFYADAAGIVVEVSGENVIIVKGDTGGKIDKKTYSKTSNQISAYFRPDWDKVKSNVINVPSYKLSGLYQNETTLHDAAIREVGYLDSRNEPSISRSKIKLSTLNYTGLLNNLYSVFGTSLIASDASSTYDQSQDVNYSGSTDSSNFDASNMDENPRIIFKYLVDKGLNAAAACGIIGNIFHESGFNTAAVGDKGTSFGICQWHDSRGVEMKQMVGSNWANNLTGQLDYLWYDITNKYLSVFSHLQSVSNDMLGVISAAEYWCIHFEVPSDKYNKAKERSATALKYWSQLAKQS